MRILAIDTARPAVSACVLDDNADAPIAAETELMERGHAEALLPMIERVMRKVEGGFPMDGCCGKIFSEWNSAMLCDPLEPEMVEIPPGIYDQGDESLLIDGLHRRVVLIERAFLIGKYPVTFAEFDRHSNAFRAHVERVGGAEGFPGLLDHWPSRSGDQGWGRDRRPVVNVCWRTAKAYAHWLAVKTGTAYRLPTEAEWEYACRAGTVTAYAFGEDISLNDAQFSHTNRFLPATTRTTEVGAFPPNPFGIYDMHGNVWEWCEDAWAESYAGSPVDGSPRMAPREADIARVLRGGSWRSPAADLTSARRNRAQQENWSDDIGFRLAVSL